MDKHTDSVHKEENPRRRIWQVAISKMARRTYELSRIVRQVQEMSTLS